MVDMTSNWADGFGAATRTWFSDVFEGPTPAQAAAWQAIGSGQHSLVIAPTGSGKTLAAFLHSLDKLSHQPATGKVRVLYISPLKALAVDVERNLRAPLRGIQLAAERLGVPAPQVQVAVRSGDTPAAERRRLLSHPPDILITTPESLFLMLSSQVVETLDEVQTVIIDEVHALAGTKRGAHLALSLERLDALSTRGGMQRIGLSATVRPAERVASFLGGDRPVVIVRPESAKRWDLSVQVPLEDMTELRRPATDDDDSPSQSIWPFIEERVLDLVDQHRSTICFVNSRRVAERLTAHLNELHAQRLGIDSNDDIATPPAIKLPPAGIMAQSGATTGRDGTDFPVVARAHHGSVSKERRAQIESDLKSGQLPCVVATSSLELGIDMGAVGLVIQVSSPPSVASGLQRIGRAGHQVGAISHGVVLPTHRGDLLESAVVTRRMLEGAIEEVHRLRNPLDVLAQQIVGLCVDRAWPVDEVWRLVRRSDPFSDLPRSAFESVLDMLSGRYPSEDFAELRPRLVWDRMADTIQGRPGARRLVVTSGGTIPDRGLFGVYLVGEGRASGKHEAGRRVGELDEEMVYESRVGDIFTLGTTSWRIEEITPNQVIVTPAPGQPGRLPFWRGDQPGRPAELGMAIAEFTDELSAAEDPRTMLGERGLDDNAATNLVDYLADQRAATGVLPGRRTILVERFRDELGDWRLCVHSSAGTAVLQPWALAIERRAKERYGVEAQVTATNDGIIARLPDVESAPPGADLVAIDPAELDELVTEQVFGSALFASRFRECAARALLLPRRDPGRRSPRWQQRMRAAQLLSVASNYPDFPISLETMRECLEDVFDLPGLTALLGDVAARRVRLVEVETPEASPFAKSLMFGYVGEFIYDGDQPLAERKLAALSLDPALLAELLGREGGAQLLDPDVVVALGEELGCRSEFRRASSAEQLWDVLRTTGPLTEAECRSASDDPELTRPWLDELLAAGRIGTFRIASVAMLAVADDAGLLRDALGVPVPAGLPDPPVTGALDALARLVVRWTQTHVVTTPEEFANRYGLPVASVRSVWADQVGTGDLVSGDYGRPDLGPVQYVRANLLAILRRRTLAALRAGVEAVEQQQFARFLPVWHELDAPAEGPDGLVAAVELLAGYPIPASMLEALVLPARVRGYHPGLLDDALARGEVVWTGHAPIGTKDGWVQLWPADTVLARPSEEALSGAAAALWERLAAGGAWRLDDLIEEGMTRGEATDALWQLVWSGHAASDTFAPVRDLAHAGALKKRAAPRPSRRSALRQLRIPQALGLSGRWAAVRPTHAPGPESLLAAVVFELGRYGVLTRGSVLTEAMTPAFPAAYRTLSAMEEAGHTRRGYFIDGLGAAQFALPGAVDRLREEAATPALLLAACDPANPFGAALPWPASDGHRPTRKAGALVVLSGGEPVVYLERGARTLVTFGHEPGAVGDALAVVARAVQEGRLDSVQIERINQVPALQAKDLAPALEGSGFMMTPQGWKARARGR